MLELSFYKPFPKYAMSFEADTCRRAARLSQQELKLTRRFLVFISTIVPCLKFQTRTQILTLTEEPNTNQVEGKMIKHFPLRWMHCRLKLSPLFQPQYPLSTSLFTESPKHRQGSDVEETTIPNAIRHHQNYGFYSSSTCQRGLYPNNISQFSVAPPYSALQCTE